MADIKVGFYKRFNGTDWDTYYFKAPASVISETTDRKWLTPGERTNISTYLSTFNSANKLLQLNASGQIPSAQLPFTISDYLKRSGGTMTGDINLNNKSLNNINTLNFKTGFDINATQDNELSLKSGGSIVLNPNNQIIDVYSSRITRLGEPTANTDAATKQYVDQLVSIGTRSVEAVKAATVSNITLSGLSKIDGYQLVLNDRVLVKNQTTTSQNGIYIAKSGSWSKVEADSLVGALVFVEHGTVNNDSTWMTKELNTWLKFSQVDLFTFGTGLTKTGNQIHLANNEITDSHIASNAMIAISKLEYINGLDTNGYWDWSDLSDLYENNDLTHRLEHIFSAIKLMRGTRDYNTTSAPYVNQSIAGAYTLAEAKNSTYIGTATPSNTGFVVGDVYIHYEV